LQYASSGDLFLYTLAIVQLAIPSLLKMRSFVLLAAAALPLAQGIRIVQSNDDGWSEANLRSATVFHMPTIVGLTITGPSSMSLKTLVNSSCFLDLRRISQELVCSITEYVLAYADDVQARLMLHQRKSMPMAAFTLRAQEEAHRQAQMPLTQD
jgi:hypothetical protein